jgi:DeoR family fructose operon transcriptional repressor
MGVHRAKGSTVAHAHPTGQALLPAQRRQRILDALRSDSATRVASLSRDLGVSTMTIRRDLDLLEQRGEVERTHGGALLRRSQSLSEFRYQASAQRHPGLKRRIARQAAAMIETGDIVFLGEGTTPALVMRYVDPALSCRIYTNNLGVIFEASGKSAELVLLGGVYQPATLALAGPATLDMIAQVHAAKTFLSADGLNIPEGVTTQTHDIAAVDRQMIRNTRGQVFLMADHTKVGLVGDYVIAAANGIDVLIADGRLDPGFRLELESLGVRVVSA